MFKISFDDMFNELSLVSKKKDPNAFAKVIYQFMGNPNKKASDSIGVSKAIVNMFFRDHQEYSSGWNVEMKSTVFEKFMNFAFDNIALSSLQKEKIENLYSDFFKINLEELSLISKDRDPNVFVKYIYKFLDSPIRELKAIFSYSKSKMDKWFIPNSQNISGWATKISKEDFEKFMEYSFKKLKLSEEEIFIVKKQYFDFYKLDVEDLKEIAKAKDPNAFAKYIYNFKGRPNEELRNVLNCELEQISRWFGTNKKGGFNSKMSKEVFQKSINYFLEDIEIVDNRYDDLKKLSNSIYKIDLEKLLEISNENNPNSFMKYLYEFKDRPRQDIEKILNLKSREVNKFFSKEKDSLDFKREFNIDEFEKLGDYFLSSFDFDEEEKIQFIALRKSVSQYTNEVVYDDFLNLPYQIFSSFKSLAQDNKKHAIAMMFIAGWSSMREQEVEFIDEDKFMVSAEYKDYDFTSKYKEFKVRDRKNSSECKKYYPKELVESIFNTYPENEELNNLLDDVANFVILKEGEELRALGQVDSELNFENIPGVLYGFRNMSRDNSSDSLMENLISISEGRGYQGLDWKYIINAKKEIRFIQDGFCEIDDDVILSVDMDASKLLKGREILKATVSQYSIISSSFEQEEFSDLSEFSEEDGEKDFKEFKRNRTSYKIGVLSDVDIAKIEAQFFLALSYLSKLENDKFGEEEAHNIAQSYIDIINIIEDVVLEEDLLEVAKNIYKQELEPFEIKMMQEKGNVI